MYHGMLPKMIEHVEYYIKSYVKLTKLIYSHTHARTYTLNFVLTIPISQIFPSFFI